MSRCIICDCSQSADSIYHNSLAGSFHTSSEPKYSRVLEGYVCIDCRESILEQRQDWRVIDGDLEFNHFEEGMGSDYTGCSPKSAR